LSDDVDFITATLLREGFATQFNRQRDGWSVTMWTQLTHRPPVGTGPTQLAALKAADADRVELLKEAAKRKAVR
jgi:hypothetical protein